MAGNKMKTGVRVMPLRVVAFYGVLGALGLGLLVWLFSVLHPLPPRVVTLACGPEGSSYAVFGKRYQKLLAKEGIEVRLVNTAGGVENLALLQKKESGIQLGFVEGGLAPDTEDPELVSLGTLCYEPLWFFTKGMVMDGGLAELKGKRVAVGPEGSDSKALLGKLLKRDGMADNAFKMLTYTTEAAADELIAGRIDAVVLLNSWASPVVRKLAAQDGIRTTSFARADAYAALFPFLTRRTLPAGAASLQKDLPKHDINLLATKTSLIARADLHPALRYLVMGILAKVHARSGIFQKTGEFPAPEETDIPLSAEARHYYKSGEPFLQRYLPFWMAALVEQWVLLLIPLLGLTYPLFKGLMAVYGWGMQRRIFSLYGELHWVEMQLDKLGKKAPDEELKRRMANLEARAGRVRVASKYLPMLYSLKETLGQVRGRFEKKGRRG